MIKWEPVKDKDGKVVKFTGTDEKNNPQPFIFEVTRHKDKDTKQERLVVVAYYDKEESGRIVTTSSKLSSDLPKLSDFGINMKISAFHDLAQQINENFYDLRLKKEDGIVTGIAEEQLKSIVRFYKEYIVDKGIKNDGGFYNIDVNEFKKEYNESTFRFDITEVKVALRMGGYTRCNRNRNDYTIKVATGKSKKHISFIASKI